MSFIRNLLALIGLAVVVVAVWGYTQYGDSLKQLPEYKAQFDSFDAEAMNTYMDLFNNLMETGDAAAATVWKAKVAEGLTPEDVEQTMRFVANEHNIKNVGELPLYQQVAADSGKEYRFAKIYMFCNAMTAARMMDYNDAYSAYLPCRLSVIEDQQGDLWIYTLNMDLMIHGGKPLPPDLKAEAIGVKETIQDIMKRGAEGDF